MSIQHLPRFLVVLLLAFLAACVLPHRPTSRAASPTVLASNGRALLPVVVGPNASDRVQAAARELGEYLGRISGTTFAVEPGDGQRGIAVGLTDDFPGLPVGPVLAGRSLADREAYLLRSHPDGVYVIGTTELAVEDAVWDLLERLGHRQFFPGPTWEVVPSAPDLQLAVDTVQRPDYYARRIWYGYGAWDYAAEPYAQWCRRNRAVAGFQLNTGHAYDGIIRRNRAAFDTHPEYYGLVNGKRTSSKFCIGNPAVRQLVCEDALRQFAANPDQDSVSVDPSDGGGWCECERCAALGSISDRALFLANPVAETVNRQHRDKHVGMYAYNYHSPPPHINADPRVIISVATAFIKGGYKLDDLIGGWARQGAMLGIREYYSVNTWDRDMPGAARGGNLGYLTRTIPEFHAQGARFLSAESSDNWGPNGLGYYVAARLLWDVDQAQRLDAIVDDFLARAFGPAQEPMREFYRVIDGGYRGLVFDDRLGRMYRHLAEARRLADAPAVRARLDALVLYARYVELYDAYAHAEKAARQAAFEQLIRHAYRMRTTMMVHTKALYRDLVHRDKSVAIPADAGWQVPENHNPWKSSQPFTAAELDGFVTAGIAAHPLTQLAFTPVTYSEDLVPATPLALSDVGAGAIAAGRGVQTFYTWVDQAPAVIPLTVTGGLIAHYRDRGNVQIDLYQVGGASETGEKQTAVAHDESVPPDGEARTVNLAAREPGLHKITVSDGRDMTRVEWPAGTPMTVQSSLDAPANLHGRWTLCFYVPKGTKEVGFYAKGEGALLDGSGRRVFRLDAKSANYFSVPVAAGQDGRLWKLVQVAGACRLMTVPPCLARDATELLLPREVVEADAR